MATAHTSWQGRAQASNKKEQTRVTKKYKGVKKVGAGKFDSEADPFMENDPILDDMDPGRSHDLKQYAKAAALPLNKAKKVLSEAEK